MPCNTENTEGVKGDVHETGQEKNIEYSWDLTNEIPTASCFVIIKIQYVTCIVTKIKRTTLNNNCNRPTVEGYFKMLPYISYISASFHMGLSLFLHLQVLLPFVNSNYRHKRFLPLERHHLFLKARRHCIVSKIRRKSSKTGLIIGL